MNLIKTLKKLVKLMFLLLLFVENIWQDGAITLGRFPMIFILWPLNNENLQALKQLVQEQLEHKHIEPSFSPWNSPVFVIKKNQENGDFL
jgi:hypothetical protein